MASLAGRVALALGLEPGERASVSLMLGHSFSMGLATVFFETAASALFLAHFGSSALPYVYIVAAVLNTATGLVYSSVQARLSFARLMQGTLALLLLSVVGLRASLAWSQAGWLFFGLLVWYRAVSTLTDLEYWALATRLYDVGQAKRLYGLIGSGEVVARIAGSFSVPLLLRFTDVSNLILLSAVALAACLWLLLRTLPLTHDATRTPAGRKSGGSLAAFARLLTSGYLQTLFGVVFFGILAKYFVDYAFLAQLKGRYPDAAELARFFGLFSGITQALSLLARLTLSGPLLARHGIRLGLLLLPTAHVLCTLLILTDSAFFGQMGVLFWLVIANQGLYKVLKHPIDNPSFKVLYQPLRSDQRLGAQIAVETMVTPIATGLAGALMLLFTAVISYTPTRFALMMLATLAGWLLVARLAGRAYGSALVAALRGRLVHDGAISFADERSLAVLGDTLKSDHPGDVRFALDLLEKNAPERLGSVLADLVAHSSADVRLAALARLERHRPPGARAAVEQRLAIGDVPAVRAAALRALAALGASDLLGPWLADPDPGPRAAAALGLFKQGSTANRNAALTALAALTDSRKLEDRLAAAAALGEMGAEPARPLLRALLVDERPTVRRAALWAVGQLRDTELLPLVLPCLEALSIASTAGRTLVAMGEAALPHLEQAFDVGPSALVRCRIVRVLGRIRGARARAWLLSRLGFPDPDVRREVLEALRAGGYHADDTDVYHLEAAVRDEVRGAVELLGAERDLALAPNHELLAGAIARQAERARERVLLLLSFLYDAKAVLSARDNLRHATRERRAYAREMLEVTLPHETRALAMPLVEELPIEERLARLAAAFSQSPRSARARVAALLEAEHFAVWPRALAIRLVRETGTAELSPRVAPLASSPEPLLRETALAYLEKTPMQTLERVLTLKSVEMFEQASEQVLAEVAEVLEEVDVKRGEVVFRRGELGDGMYVIVDGRVRVFDGDVTLGVLGERDIFGELALLDPEPRSASIAALADTRLFRLDREAFAELMAGNIEIVRGVLHVLCERLRRQIAAGTAQQRR